METPQIFFASTIRSALESPPLPTDVAQQTYVAFTQSGGLDCFASVIQEQMRNEHGALTGASFQEIKMLFNFALREAQANSNFQAARILEKVAGTIQQRSLEDGKLQTLKAVLAENPLTKIWKWPEYWEATFFSDVGNIRESVFGQKAFALEEAVVGWASLSAAAQDERRRENVKFILHSLGCCAHDMRDCGVESKVIDALIANAFTRFGLEAAGAGGSKGVVVSPPTAESLLASPRPVAGSNKHKDSAAAEAPEEEATASLSLRLGDGVFEMPLLSQEAEVARMNDVIFIDCKQSERSGSLHISNARLFFVFEDQRFREDFFYQEFAAVPLASISHVDTNIDNRNSVHLEVHCKDIRVLTLTVPGSRDGKRLHPQWQLFERELHSRPYAEFAEPDTKAFCFKFKLPRAMSRRYPGWRVYDAASEFYRQGVIGTGWVISRINHTYKLSETYPRLLVLPGYADATMLKAVAKFRSRRRLPAVTYYHKSNSAALIRCSQPRVGISRTRSTADEEFFELCGVRNVFDCRGKSAAMGNMAMGKGYEFPQFYTMMTLRFLDIENIHAMRNSLAELHKLLATEATEDEQWFTLLDKTMWLHHMQLVLLGTAKLCDEMLYGKTCLVHCSDGWDRTSQLCALAQLLLDPFFRTLRGFAVLVEKDWLSFGHMFARRLGHGDRNHADEQRSPIFIQFLDCCWQLLQQFPTAFQFNADALSFLAYHVSSCQFGTFLFNTERQRNEQHLKRRTASIWTVLLGDPSFTNTAYRQHEGTLDPNVSLRRLAVWPFHYKYNRAMTRQDKPAKIAAAADAAAAAADAAAEATAEAAAEGESKGQQQQQGGSGSGGYGSGANRVRDLTSEVSQLSSQLEAQRSESEWLHKRVAELEEQLAAAGGGGGGAAGGEDGEDDEEAEEWRVYGEGRSGTPPPPPPPGPPPGWNNGAPAAASAAPTAAAATAPSGGGGGGGNARRASSMIRLAVAEGLSQGGAQRFDDGEGSEGEGGPGESSEGEEFDDDADYEDMAALSNLSRRLSSLDFDMEFVEDLNISLSDPSAFVAAQAGGEQKAGNGKA